MYNCAASLRASIRSLLLPSFSSAIFRGLHTTTSGAPFGVGFGWLPQPLRKGTPSMDSKKYIGMDVHKESISIAVMNGAGKIGMECVIETKASTILQFIDGLRGDVHVTFEEGTSAAWLYDLLKPHVTKLVVCDPRKNASMREGTRVTRSMHAG